MTTSADLIADLQARDIRLRADGDRLVIDAPQDTLTDEIRARLREHKAEVLRTLTATDTAEARIREWLAHIRETDPEIY